MLYARPDLLHRVLAINAEAVAAYLARAGRARCGCADDFRHLGRPAHRRRVRDVFARLHRGVLERVRATLPRPPTIVFTKGGGQWLERIAACGCDAVGLDWTTDIAAARRRVGARVALQGNLDPHGAAEHAGSGAKRQRVPSSTEPVPAPGHIFNLGHGILPATPPENVAALVEAVHDDSRALRASIEVTSGNSRRNPRQCWVCEGLDKTRKPASPGHLCTVAASRPPREDAWRDGSAGQLHNYLICNKYFVFLPGGAQIGRETHLLWRSRTSHLRTELSTWETPRLRSALKKE